MKEMESTLKEKDVTINEMEINMKKVEQELKKVKESKSSPEKMQQGNLQQENVILPVAFIVFQYL